MGDKVVLISIDGMRPDGLLKCGNPYVDELKKIASYTLNARTVFPSVTLPCHMSMFHSIPPERHGILTNTYTPPVRPVNGLFEQLKASGKTSCMYYGWDNLRDISRPGSLVAAEYINSYSLEHTDGILTDKAVDYINKAHPDFCFLYMVETDEKGGHDSGWMSDTYLEYIYFAVNNVRKVIEETKGEYSVIVTADHGGHDRVHGTEADEDMVIPMIFYGRGFTPGRELTGVSILDIAPTVSDIMNIPTAAEWEGKSVLT